MASRIDTEKLYRYCRIPVDQLVDHPESHITLKMFDDAKDVFTLAGNMMADEVIKNNKEGKLTKWVLPAGPNDQYKTFIDRVNKERISLKNLWVFLMDEVLDFNCRTYPKEGKLFTAEGKFERVFYNKIDPELNVPMEQRWMPRINNMDEIDAKIAELGPLDAVYGGLGFRGLVAYCEPPYEPWFTVTEEEYCNMKTRIWPINVDTTIASAERNFGGLTHHLPRLGISIGFKSMLNTKKVIFISTTGAWKRASVRMLMFGEPTVEYPATLFTDKVPVTLIADKNTCLPPLQD